LKNIRIFDKKKDMENTIVLAGVDSYGVAFTTNDNNQVVMNGKLYEPSFVVIWNDMETNANPDVLDTCCDIEDAIEVAKQGGDFWNGTQDHVATVQVHLTLLQYNEYYEEWQPVGKSELLELDKPIFDLVFEPRDLDAENLLSEVEDKLGNDLAAHLGCTYIGNGKYSSLELNNGKSIKLRIADHSYNPANNMYDSDFISVEICNENKTKGRFNGKWSIEFTGSNTYEDVLDGVIEELNSRFDFE